MDLDDYQKEATKTNRFTKHPGCLEQFIYMTLGLVGESGEIAEKVKKIIRDDNGKISKEKREEIKKELGDVLRYLSQLSLALDIPFSEIAKINLKKLKSRKNRGVICGSGDNR
jgi:NTP pyrophosphatase (non-canonical NTP hydrolase)